MILIEESKECDNHKYNQFQEFTPTLPIRLSNLTREDNQKILIKHLNLNISQTFPIQQGLSLSQSSLAGFSQKFWENMQIFREPSYQPLALIFPDYIKEEKIKQIKACNIDPVNGLYIKISKYLIQDGMTKFGFPAGENTIQIEKNGPQIVIKIKSDELTYNIDNGWKDIIFVKTKPKKLEAGDQNYNFLELGPSEDTSRKHATLTVIDKSLYMIDGIQNPEKKSANGVYVYLSLTAPRILNEDDTYVLGDFRIVVKLQRGK